MTLGALQSMNSLIDAFDKLQVTIPGDLQGDIDQFKANTASDEK